MELPYFLEAFKTVDGHEGFMVYKKHKNGNKSQVKFYKLLRNARQLMNTRNLRHERLGL